MLHICMTRPKILSGCCRTSRSGNLSMVERLGAKLRSAMHDHMLITSQKQHVSRLCRMCASYPKLLRSVGSEK